MNKHTNKRTNKHSKCMYYDHSTCMYYDHSSDAVVLRLMSEFLLIILEAYAIPPTP